jgi:hypothetical protein
MTHSHPLQTFLDIEDPSCKFCGKRWLMVFFQDVMPFYDTEIIEIMETLKDPLQS